MQIFVLFWIALCLVADTSTKSVPSTDHETGTGDLSVPLHGNADANQTTEECKCENGFCEKSDRGKWVCKCPPEWGRYSSTYCKKCDCGKDSNCTFSGFFETTKKCLCKVGYMEFNGTCVGDCSQNPCKNGGTCQVTRGEVTCQCKDGFHGDDCSIKGCECKNGFCEKNDRGKWVCKCPPEWGLFTSGYCKKCDCGKDSNCTFSGVYITTKDCICNVGYKDFNGTCKGTCKDDSDCMNGAKCEQNGTGHFCRCLNGTEGDFCEEVSGCKHLDCGPDARCTYDALREKAMCSCENQDLVFDDKERRCKNVCYPNPCKNGGTCNATRGEMTCHCKDRFRGPDCSIDVCLPNPCKNNGTCNATRGEATCQCKDRFQGADCSIDVCLPNPCKNGGTCNATRGEMTCQCKDRFRGADCSIDVCSPNPCRNGGVCNVTRKGAICQCTDHFRGADCSIEMPVIATSTFRYSTMQPTSSSRSRNFTVGRESTLRLTTIVPTTGTDPCTESPCQNGGTCVTVGNTQKCLCKKPYLGNLCETDPCDWNPCKNGGVCKVEYETVRCFCREPFTGEFCESVIGVRSRIDPYVIALFAGTVFLTALLTFVTCILCQRYHATRSRSEYS